MGGWARVGGFVCWPAKCAAAAEHFLFTCCYRMPQLCQWPCSIPIVPLPALRCPCPSLQRKVLEQFHAMRDSSWRVIDASQSIDNIQQQLREQAAAVVARCQRGATPLGQLWEGAAPGGGAPLADINNVQ